MKTIKTVISLILVVCILFSCTACSFSSGKNNSSSGDKSQLQSGYESSTEEDYNSTTDEWKDEDGVSDDDFDNTTDQELPTPTPGEDDSNIQEDDKPIFNTSDNVTSKDETSSEDKADTDSDKEDEKKGRGFPLSSLAFSDQLQYFYDGSNYAYGIDENGYEYISFKAENGEMFDVLAGAGRYSLKSTTNISLINVGTVKCFQVLMKDGYESVIVEYDLSGVAASKSTVQTTYIFKESNISIASHISADTGKLIISNENSAFLRNFANDYIDDSVNINSEWVYPADGDYPYPDFESLAFKTKMTDDIMLYSYVRGDEIATVYQISKYNSSLMPLTFEDSNGLFYTHEYDLSFVDTLVEKDQGADYLGLFKSKSSEFAAGVAPVVDPGDNSTVFIGNEVDLNINVTNLTEDDLKFSLRYDIRDYYGNIIDKGIFINSKVYKYTDANRNVKVKGKYGMYYLNLYVISRYSSYAECYPFMLLEDYNYKYNATSPFGVNSPWRSHESVTYNTAKVYSKIGVATTRINSDDVELAAELHKLGITQINGIIGMVNREESNNENFIEAVSDTVNGMKDYIDSFEVGNEMNLDTIGVENEEQAVDELYRLFYKYTYLPSKKLFKESYPKIGYIPTPFSAGQVAWVTRLTEGYLEDINGDGIEERVGDIWDEIEIVSTHIYGTPWMPDQYSTYEPEWGKATWCIEGALQRLDYCLTTFCKDKTDIDLYITEVGYNTRPGIDIDVCLRTQADYNTRSIILSSAYGADRIQVYNMYDRRNHFAGFQHDYDQLNFGIFYDADYYNRIVPKPAAAAFAVLTRQLESIEKNSCQIFDKYDEGWDQGGVRAFKCNTDLYGEVVMAWSNAEILTNGKKNAMGTTGARIPTLPWNNQWTLSDDTEFDAVSDTVKVVDVMGNTTVYKAKDNKVTIPLTGSPVYIYGVK